MNRKVSIGLRALGLLLLLGLAYTGIAGAIGQFQESALTTGQRLQTTLQLVFGVFSILAIVVAFRPSRWRPVVNAVFIVSTTLAGGLAPIVWGDQGLGPGYAAGAASLLVCSLIVWLVGPHRQSSSSVPTL